MHDVGTKRPRSVGLQNKCVQAKPAMVSCGANASLLHMNYSTQSDTIGGQASTCDVSVMCTQSPGAKLKADMCRHIGVKRLMSK